jgi:hypothetical protein
VRAEAKTSQHERAGRRASSTYALRIEHLNSPTLEIDANSAGDKPSFLVPANLSIMEASAQANWWREFTVLGRHTLEQLNEIILHLLGWDSEHLYEFRIAERVYTHLVFLGEDDFVVEAGSPCVSCDIPIRLLGLSVGDVFAYIYDFCDYHTFRIAVLDIRPTLSSDTVPALLSCQGKNIIQYPGSMDKAEAMTFRNRTPAVAAPKQPRGGLQVRFIRYTDGLVLREWRASNNKKL